MSTHKDVNRTGRPPSPQAICWRIGDVVNYHSRIGGPVTTSGHTIREIGVLSGRTVAWITGKVGCVAIEALSANAAPEPRGD
jgi:hypothetical protein